MPAGKVLVIDLEQGRLGAVVALRQDGRVRVLASHQALLPDDVAHDDAQAVGAWLREELRAAGLNCRRAIFVLPRQRVILKRLTLPTTRRDELPEIARLALQRDLPIETESPVIDAAPIAREEHSTTVLAVAAQPETVQWVRDVSRGARLSLERIALRTLGSAALIATMGGESELVEAPTLVVDAGSAEGEFSVIIDGTVRFARSAAIGAEAGPDADPEEFADALLTALRRTWMSYRMSDDAEEVRRVIVMGPAHRLRPVIEQVSRLFALPIERLETHPFIIGEDESMNGLWPLAGVALESTLDREHIDLAHPRRAVDPATRRRQRVLAIAGVLIVMLFGAWTFARRDLAGLKQEVASAQETVDKLTPRYMRYVRDTLKVEHLEQWQSIDVQWLDHLRLVSSYMPEPNKPVTSLWPMSTGLVILDGWKGSLDAGTVAYDHSPKLGEPKWSQRPAITVIVEGEATTRYAADAFRAALVQSQVYETRSAGADARAGRRLPVGFTYQLHTAVQSPALPPPAIADAGDATQAQPRAEGAVQEIAAHETASADAPPDGGDS